MQIFNSFIIHLTQYHETDQMGVIHHANYVKWMEEARNNFFNDVKIDLSELEQKHVFIPVLSQTVNYNKAIRYNQKIKITCICEKFNGVKLDFSYVFYDMENEEICAKGKTTHGFVDSNFNPVLFKEQFIQEYNSLKNSIKVKN